MKNNKNDFKDLIITALKRQGRMPLSRNELMQKCHIKKKYKLPFLRGLDELRREGIVVEERGRFKLADKAGLLPAVIGRIHGTFGFARLEDGTELFIPGRYLMGAMEGDEVLLRRSAGEGDLDEGRVCAITKENDALISGELSFEEEGVFLQPDGGARHTFRVDRVPGEAQPGDKVLARLTYRGMRHSEHRVGIVHNFGQADKAENSAAAVLAASGVDRRFEESLLMEADRLAQSGISVEEMAGREDLRDLPIFTIDGAYTKDIDDAISLTETETGYRLGVHIADVSYYVRPGSELDEEAYARGTSVYFVNQVIPMLPPGLSNGICSLNPDEDRLAFSVFIDIDQDGAMTDYRFVKSVIRSRLKGVYGEINALLAGEADAAIQAKYKDLEGEIRRMEKLAAILYKRRASRGALELESTECAFVMDETGHIADILPAGRGVSEEMIESFMLMANQAAATFAESRELPFIFRVHENPPATKIAELRELLGILGISAKDIEPGVSSGALSRVLSEAAQTPYRRIVNNTVLRSMAKAIYSDENVGHFGLVMNRYSHFTSPIRRYPDLYIHRIMSDALADSGRLAKTRARYGGGVKAMAAHCSATEQRAVSVERTIVDIYKADYMRRFLGQEMDGVIVSATPMGLYVELTNTVEGLVKSDRLPGGPYTYDGRMAYTNAAGRSFKVGDAVKILVSAVSVSLGRVDFDIRA